MFWKIIENDCYSFVAITKLKQIRKDQSLYGQRCYQLTLADGSKQEHTFEHSDWVKFAESVTKGGMVLNA